MRRMATRRLARSGPSVGILEILFTVALRHQVFGRDAEVISKDLGNRLSAPIRKAEVV